ncbi:MAG: acyl-CoA desaturase [Myxococcota bacterium]|nr:acyl-CoA desaturase [Myxococcota bacterium]
MASSIESTLSTTPRSSALPIAAPRSAAQRPAAPEADPDGAWLRHGDLAAWLYWGIHASCALALVTGVSTLDVALCLGFFWLRMFGITGGYHRYFAHRTYRTGRVFQFALAALGCSAVQKGPLWWASGHRRHHRYSDQPGDLHSPREGLWYAHQGWVFDLRWSETEVDQIADFARFPELVWLNRYHFVPPLALGVFCLAVGGFSGLVWGFSISTTLLWHSTYTINSLAHRYGSVRYDTGDDSRNNAWLALLTLGEGWHNNHHRYMASARNGFFWWEIDVTWYLLRGLAKLGVVRALRTPPRALVEPPH